MLLSIFIKMFQFLLSNNNIMNLNIFLYIIIFLIGLYFYCKTSGVEGFTTEQPRCPNLLIQKGTKFYLYNSKIAKVPGVNPVEFDNLEDYTEFLDWQRSQGIRCPVLYLQESYDAQGSKTFKIRPSVTELQGGLPPSNKTSNQINPNPSLLVEDGSSDINTINQVNTISGSDSLDMNNITQSQLANAVISPDPMDDNWGGSKYTQSLVDQGYYEGNEVSIAVTG
jgi:hypothetical protein